MREDPVVAVGRISSVPTILRVITEVTGLRLSLISHVTDDTWTCCAVNDQLQFGLEVGGHLEVATTLCSEVRKARSPIVISHASADPVYCSHRTPKMYAFESYIAVPIHLRNGDYFGNVCALDSRPLPLAEPKTLALFQLFAELVGLQLEAEARHEATSQALLDANQAAELREQFIAVLGHDLRTPLGSITIGIELLSQNLLSPQDTWIIERVSRSVKRIARLIDDVLDFARGRLGGGIPLREISIANANGLFQQVVSELAALHPDRVIDAHIDVTALVHGDPDRLAQLVQNLLGNALAHSSPTAQVKVEIHVEGSRQLVLAVSNQGPAIPAPLRSRMFEPYQRGTSKSSGGLGLGLYIASEIVRAHHGTIAVTSADGVTTFTCKLPLLTSPTTPAVRVPAPH